LTVVCDVCHPACHNCGGTRKAHSTHIYDGDRKFNEYSLKLVIFLDVIFRPMPTGLSFTHAKFCCKYMHGSVRDVSLGLFYRFSE